MNRLVAILTARDLTSGPDVLVAYQSLDIVIKAARALLENKPPRQGYRRLERHVKAIERDMAQAVAADESNRLMADSDDGETV